MLFDKYIYYNVNRVQQEARKMNDQMCTEKHHQLSFFFVNVLYICVPYLIRNLCFIVKCIVHIDDLLGSNLKKRIK